MRPRNLLLAVPALAVTLFTLTACQLTGPSMPAPLSRGAAQAVQYTGAVSQESWVTAATPKAEIDPGPEPIPEVEKLVNLKTSIYVIDRNAATHLLSLPFAGLVAAVVDHDQCEEALAAMIRQGTASLITRQQVGCLDRSRAVVTWVRQKSYVQGYDLLGIEDAMVADPKIGVVKDGMLLDLRPTRSPDRATLELELKLTLTKLESPLPTVRVAGRLPTEGGLLLELPNS